MEMFSPVLQRFINERPVSVMARAAIERMFDPAVLNQLFDDHAERQYTRELTFAHVVELMCDVVFGIAPSVHASYQRRAETIAVSATALYEKINGIEPSVCQALLRYSYQQAEAVHRCYAPEQQWLAGYRIKIVDGNHFSASEHRLKELRRESAAPLPGKAVVVLDVETMSISDVYLDEDGHAQERVQIPALLERVTAGELWIADRLYATLGMIAGVARRGARFLMRQHGSLAPQAVDEPVYVGDTETGRVSEQTVRVCSEGEELLLRRITVELKTPTRNGDNQIHLLTNVPSEDATATEVSDLYLKRWTIEGAFFELTTTLCCEIKSLCYPKAALLTFTLALVSYNIVSLIKAALRAAHGSQTVDDEISPYYLTLEIRQTAPGLAIAVDDEQWQQFVAMSPQHFADSLQQMAMKMKLACYRKHKRGPKKKKPKKKPYVNGAHLSTAAILAKRSPP